MNAEIVIFGGSAHPELADEICRYLSVPRSPVRISRFANDCLQVQLQANCRERDVYLIQPLVAPVQENLVELLLMADAARGASAARVTAVMPHYAYARSDKKDAPRISIGGRLVADLLVTAGVNRVLTLTLHSAEVHGFFSVPVDHLHALRELAAHFSKKDLSNAVVLSPDLGYAKSAAAFARRLGLPVAAGAKERFSDSKVTISAIIGEVADRDVIILDDEIARGTTVIELLLGAAQAGGAVDQHRLHARAVRRRGAGEAGRGRGRRRDRLHELGADRGQAPEADRALRRPGPGRGDQADARRRVGQRPVRAVGVRAGAQPKRLGPRVPASRVKTSSTIPPTIGMNPISSHQPDRSVSCSRRTASGRPKISQATLKTGRGRRECRAAARRDEAMTSMTRKTMAANSANHQYAERDARPW